MPTPSPLSTGAASAANARDSIVDYRADVDGLRALAIIAVMLFHTGSPWMPGGYLGVDMFFVISGFLITRILRARSLANWRSLGWFYERRIRRIFPALLLVLAASAGAAWVLLAPPDIMRFARSLVATALFSFNIKAISERGYFSPQGQDDPLLHTWSLSVEEQFYLLFPLMLVLARDWTRTKYMLLCTALMAVSLLSAIWLGMYSPNAAFYFGVPRAWELLLGSLLAVVGVRAAGSPWLAQVSGLAGLAMVAFSLVTEPTGSFATIDAVPACVGTALVIWSGSQRGTIARAALSWRPLVLVGLLSYSLYLWHWPLIVFYRASVPFERLPIAGLMAGTFLLAALSWRFVEQPSRLACLPRRRVLGLAVAAVIACLLVGAALGLSRGGDWRASQRARSLYSFDNYPAGAAARDGSCFLSPRHVSLQYFDAGRCLPAANGKPRYLLVGDSHAAHLWAGLAQAFPDATVQQATASACAPLLGFGSTQCQAFMDEILGRVVPATRPEAVVLSARWDGHSMGALRRTIAALLPHTRSVIVIGPIVEYRMALPRVLALAGQRGDPSLVARARVDSGAELDASMALALHDSGATYLSAYRALCLTASGTGSGCTTTTGANETPVQFDYGHLTIEGAVLVAQRLRFAAPAAWPR
jgi:peptidoglycan/LPS O-acetylase OafA/YrhL